MENPIKMDDLVVPLFLETSIWGSNKADLREISPFFVALVWCHVSMYDPCNNSDPQFSRGEKVTGDLGDQQFGS